MDVQIRLSKEDDLTTYANLLQKIYEDIYPDEKLGLTKGCFSKEVFGSQRVQAYLKSNLRINNNQKTWLAFIGNELVGSITIERKNGECELRGFYTSTDHQGRGIGKKLWQLASDFSGTDDITLDIYSHNTKIIEMYKRWGFVVEKEAFYWRWPEWPEGIKVGSLYMRLQKNV